MRTKNGKWLDTALRAQQAWTLDHRYRVHETLASHEQAELQEATALQKLQALASSWRRGRDTGQLTQDLDRLYQRFHALLGTQAVDAARLRAEHQQLLDAALQQLRYSYAQQQGLDRTVQRRDRRLARDTQAKERGSAGEAWLLAQAGKKGSDE